MNIFEGRGSRAEFWFWMSSILILGYLVIDADLNGKNGWSASGMKTLPTLLFPLVALFPITSIALRRLHDTDRSGLWFLLIFVPIIGWLILVYWFVSEGTEGPNRFDEYPPSDESEAGV